jgi:hypothetical protein
LKQTEGSIAPKGDRGNGAKAVGNSKPEIYVALIIRTFFKATVKLWLPSYMYVVGSGRVIEI